MRDRSVSRVSSRDGLARLLFITKNDHYSLLAISHLYLSVNWHCLSVSRNRFRSISPKCIINVRKRPSVIPTLKRRRSTSGLGNEIGGRDRVKLHGARSAAEVNIGAVCNCRVQLPRFLHAVPRSAARGEKRFLKEIDGSTNAKREANTRRATRCI